MEESERDLIKNSFGTPRNEEIPLSNTIYLDHAGAPLPSKSLLSSVFEELMNLPFGNPHSGGNDSAVSKIISEARRKTLSHFGAKEEDYEVIFTSGATAAIKLVGETFPWSDGSELWFPPNAHTSLLGLRGFTKEGRTRCVGDCGFYPALQQIYFARLADNHQNLCTKCSQLLDCLKMKGETSDRMVHNLIAVPGECNMSGAKLQLLTFANFVESLNAISKVNRFYWLLDAAKLAGSSGVDLSALDHAQRPHFVALSYYKIFGYPTGLGALIVKRDIMHILKKSYFGGGTLLAGAVDRNFQVSKPVTSHEHFEDGTPNFHGIAAIRHGFNFIDKIGGMNSISYHTEQLRLWLEDHMREMHHFGDITKPLCILYMDSRFNSLEYQGGVIAFNLQYASGHPVSFHEVGKIAAINKIQLRTGCFCNVGGCQLLLNITGDDAIANYQLGRICSTNYNDVDIINNKNTGLCRISLGYGSTLSDCKAFIEFLRKEFLNRLSGASVLQDMLPPNLKNHTDDVYNKSIEKRNENIVDKDSNEDDDRSLFWHQDTYHYPWSSIPSSRKVTEKFNRELQGKPSVKIAALFVYPIKSCSGIRVDNWPINNEGLLFDRYFAIADDRGSIINQKQYPQMALIQPMFEFRRAVIECANGSTSWSSTDQSSSINHRIGQLVLQISTTTSIMDSVLEIPLSSCSALHTETVYEETCDEYRVCGRKTKGRKISHDADEWITQFLFLTSTAHGKQIPNNDVMRKGDRKQFYLVRSTMLENNTDVKVSDRKTPFKSVNSFANTAQYLLLSIHSVKALIQMMQDSTILNPVEQQDVRNIKIENFRPNIVVSKDPESCKILDNPHMEDGWKYLTFPAKVSSKPSRCVISLAVEGPCSRCSMVNVNGQSGVMDCRVFDALKDYRKQGSSVYFGQFLSFHLTKPVQPDIEGDDITDCMTKDYVHCISVGDRWFVNE